MTLFPSFGRSFWLTALGAVVAIGVTGQAFTAGLTGSQTSNTGTSTTTIGGYNVTSVSYTLNSTTPTNITAITFTIVSPGTQPSFVRAQADSTGGTFYTCTLAAALPNYNATCATTSPQLIVADADSMTIVVSK